MSQIEKQEVVQCQKLNIADFSMKDQSKGFDGTSIEFGTLWKMFYFPETRKGMQIPERIQRFMDTYYQKKKLSEIMDLKKVHEWDPLCGYMYCMPGTSVDDGMKLFSIQRPQAAPEWMTEMNLLERSIDWRTRIIIFNDPCKTPTIIPYWQTKKLTINDLN